MANSDKNILITPNTGSSSANPIIRFTGANNTPLSLRVLDSGTLSFEGTAGQLFSISDGLTGTIYSVNDISGMPSIELLDTGLLKLTQYSGSTVFGAAAAFQSSSVNAKVSISTVFATTPGLIVRGVTSQSAYLQDWQNSSGGSIASVSASGGANFTGSVNVGAGGFVGATIQEAVQTGSLINLTSATSNTNNTGNIVVRARFANQLPLVVRGSFGGSSTITNATANGTTVTYTSGNSLFYVAGQQVTVTGVVSTGNTGATAGAGFNLTNATIASASSTQFTVTNPLVDTYTSGGSFTATAQTADLQQWQNPSNVVLARVYSDGAIFASKFTFNVNTWNNSSDGRERLYFANNGGNFYRGNDHTFRNNSDATLLSISSNGQASITPATAATIGLIVRGAASQTANLQEWQNSSSTVLSAIDPSGNFTKGDGDQLVLAGQIF